MHFWPDPKFFDSPNFSAPQLKHVLKAKAVLCPGLRMKFFNEATGEKDEWFFSGDLGAYLLEEARQGRTSCPPSPSPARASTRTRTSTTRSCWAPDAENFVSESYVNLIPTTEGGTHVNGLRARRVAGGA